MAAKEIKAERTQESQGPDVWLSIFHKHSPTHLKTPGHECNWKATCVWLV